MRALLLSLPFMFLSSPSWAGESAPAASCERLSEMPERQLADFDFNSAKSALEHLRPNRSYIVGKIRVVRLPIFNASDPKENNWLFNLADRLHIDTLESVIREVILFRPGSATTLDDLAESERILRNKNYLYDARVIPQRLCGNRLDIDIVTKEVWSMDLELNLDRSGGDNNFGIGLNDSNFLGKGQGIGVGYSDNLDRQGINFFYTDPNIAGSRVAASLFLADNDDGSRQVLDLRQPFYSLNSRFGLGLRVDRFDQEQGLYFLGRQFAEFKHDGIFADLSGGFSRGIEDDKIHRLLFGVSYEEDNFKPISRFAPNPFPRDRKLVYPWIGFEGIQNDFQKTDNYEQISRTEDLFLGRQYRLRLGYAAEAFGSDDHSRLVIRGSYRDAAWFRKRHLLIYGASVNGYYNFAGERAEDMQAVAFATYRFKQGQQFSFFASAAGAFVRNLPADKQLLLGGDSGLRGYPNRFQLGDRRFLVTLEERYFSNVYLFNIFRLGAAVFVDSGRAWSTRFPSNDEFGLLTDVGFGLRIESTRTRRNRILHIDLAFPLQDGPGVGTSEFTIEVKQSL